MQQDNTSAATHQAEDPAGMSNTGAAAAAAASEQRGSSVEESSSPGSKNEQPASSSSSGSSLDGTAATAAAVVVDNAGAKSAVRQPRTNSDGMDHGAMQQLQQQQENKALSMNANSSLKTEDDSAAARGSPVSATATASGGPPASPIGAGNVDEAAALALAHVDTPIAVPGPYRNNQHRLQAHQLPRGILKPAPVPQARFSFRRDVLNYVGESIASVASSVGTLSQQQQQSVGGEAQGVGATASGSQQQQHGSLQYLQKDNGQSSQIAAQPAPPAAATAAAPRGAFWRRIGGAVNAVASQVPAAQAVAQRTFTQLSSSPSTSEPPHPPSSSSSPIASTSTLPTSSASIESDNSLLDSIKSVRFTMSNLTVVYPINAPAPPGTEATTRKRINREYRTRVKERTKRGGWTGEELLRLYDECCRTREEPGIEQIRRLLMDSAQPPKVIDLKDVPLSKGAVEVLSDLLSVDFSLRRLSLENCGLDDDSLKPLIHSLLCSGTLPTLSLANNKRIRTKGWKLVAVLVKRANQLKYLDVSENLVDRKIAEILVEAIVSKGGELRQRQHTESIKEEARENGHAQKPLAASRGPVSDAGGQVGDSTDGEGEDLPPRWAAPLLSHRRRPQAHFQAHSHVDTSSLANSGSSSSALTSLRLEACQLKNPALECLAHGIRQSGIKHISLRRNRITQSGAVSLAVMIRDYELPPGGTEAVGASAASSAANGLFSAGLLSPPLHGEERPGSPALSANGYSTPPLSRASQHVRSPPPANSVTARLEAAAQAAAASSSTRAPPPLPPKNSRSSSLLSTSSTVHSTTSTLIDESAAAPGTYSEDDRDSFGPERNRGRVVVLPEREAARHAELKARLRKQIDALPRVGCLLTLDVRSNEIKGGVTYIAQVLKRNRTLKVLNLSDNKIDSQGLMSIAEALKYNSTLETLDLSNNPCCGTSLEGINTLRTALAFNSSLMRVFLTNTDFNTSAAISLAEFLPEVHSLIHLDLTDNADIELAGIMALAAAVRLNTTLRCLDLSIPPNDPEYARLSQDVLQSCIRNTEAAQEQSAAKGIAKASIATPIYKSEIARELREISEHGRRTLEKAERYLLATSSSSSATVTGSTDEGTGGELDLKRIVTTAKECIGILRETIEPDEERKRKSEASQGAETVKLVLDQAYAATSQLEELRKKLQGKQKEAAGIFSSHLGSLVARAKTLYDSDQQQQGQQTRPGGLALDADAGLLSPLTPVKSPLSPSEQLPSPNFSITSSDDDEDDDSDTYSLDGDGRTPTVSPIKSARLDKNRPPRPAALELPTPIFEAPANADPSPRSPVEKSSRIMVSEEAEVFRKSTAKVSDGASSKTLLDVLDDDEGEDKGAEELKKELLDAAVEKKTRRSSLTDIDALEPARNE